MLAGVWRHRHFYDFVIVRTSAGIDFGSAHARNSLGERPSVGANMLENGGVAINLCARKQRHPRGNGNSGL